MRSSLSTKQNGDWPFTHQVPPPAVAKADAIRTEAEHERIRELGANPSPIQTVPGVVRYFEFRDPYGNRLSCYQVVNGSHEGTA